MSDAVLRCGKVQSKARPWQQFIKPRVGSQFLDELLSSLY